MAVLFYEEAYDTVVGQFDKIREEYDAKTLTGLDAVEEIDKIYGELIALCARFEQEFNGMELDNSDKMMLAKLSGLLNHVINFTKKVKGHEVREESNAVNPYKEIRIVPDAKELNLKEKIPLHYLRNLFTSEDHSSRIVELEKEGYKELLILRKDGNSFYRALYVQLLEQALKNEALLRQFIDTLLLINTDHPKIQIDRLEVLDILNQALEQKSYLNGTDPYDHFSTNREFDGACIRLLRKISRDYLRDNKKKPVLGGLTPEQVLDALGYSVDNYVNELRSDGCEADLVALDLLPLALNVRVYIADFLGKNLTIVEHGSGIIVGHLLQRPGRHFDILYK